MDQQDELIHRVVKLERKCLSLQIACVVLVFCVIGLGWMVTSYRHVLWETVKSNVFAVYDEDGDLRGAFGINDAGDPEIVLLDENGEPVKTIR